MTARWRGLSRRWRRLIVVAALAALCVVCLPAAARGFVVFEARGRVFTSPRAVPKRQVALVLGARVTADGDASLALEQRVRAAVSLYKSGRVAHLLMSGDNSRREYDEPTVMRRLAVQAGLPKADLTLDYAGFDTWDSCVRAGQIFGVADPVVVTQGFHADRAVFLCRRAGLDAVGFGVSDAALPDRVKLRLRAREWLAAPKAVFEAFTTEKPTYLGEPVGLVGSERPANPDPVIDG